MNNVETIEFSTANLERLAFTQRQSFRGCECLA